jgi:hypothetical protein
MAQKHEFPADSPMSDFQDFRLAHLTRQQYIIRLKMFFDSLGLSGSLDKQSRKFLGHVKKDGGKEWAQNGLKYFIRDKKQRAEKGELAESSVRNFYKPVKLFCSIHDVELSWKKITNTIPDGRKFANDRAPTHEEIQTIVEYPDRRIKPIVLVTCSSGIRIGAWEYLKWKHIEPIRRNDRLVAAKIIVYGGENEQYFSFMTPEAFHSVKEWMDFRKKSGEDVNGESWVMIGLWDTRTAPPSPQRLDTAGLRALVQRALLRQGLRKKIDMKIIRRHEFKTNHGFRKFFQTNCEPKMKSLDVMTLMGQDTGLAASYNKPTVDMLLDEYLKAVDNLTINKQIEFKEVAENQQVLLLQMQTKDREIMMLKKQMVELESREQEITMLKQRLSEMNTLTKEVDSMREQIAALKRSSDEFQKLSDMTNLLQEAVDIAKIADPSLANISLRKSPAEHNVEQS